MVDVPGVYTLNRLMVSSPPRLTSPSTPPESANCYQTGLGRVKHVRLRIQRVITISRCIS